MWKASYGAAGNRTIARSRGGCDAIARLATDPIRRNGSFLPRAPVGRSGMPPGVLASPDPIGRGESPLACPVPRDLELLRCRPGSAEQDWPEPPPPQGAAGGGHTDPSKSTNSRQYPMPYSQVQELAADGPERVAAVVALTILQVIRAHDRPSEVFEGEDTSITMPRRLGLSGVVERQIRTYQEATKRRGKISDQEFADLVRLVAKRPDSADIFFECGTRLAHRPSHRHCRFMPRRLALAVARRRVRGRLKWLFGRQVGGFAGDGFTMEGCALLFMQSDPSGSACALVSGLCSAVLGATIRGVPTVDHVACESRGDAYCRWGIPRRASAEDP